jgi:pyruvate dehydrogenase E2 component (dihydrolipoamide acetyltransferase)
MLMRYSDVVISIVLSIAVITWYVKFLFLLKTLLILNCIEMIVCVLVGLFLFIYRSSSFRVFLPKYGIGQFRLTKLNLEMRKEIKMPALSSTMKEGKIVSWSKKVGDKVSSGDVLLVVESDKADMDVESFEDGYLASILVKEGGVATVGAPVALISKSASDIAAVQSITAEGIPATSSVSQSPVPALSSTLAATTSNPSIVNTGRVAASGYAQALAKEKGIDLRTVTPSRPDAYITSVDLVTGKAGGSTSSHSIHIPAPGVVNASPMARKLAAENNVDVSKIKGTGNFGRVMPDDVLIACGKKTISAPVQTPVPANAPLSSVTTTSIAATSATKPASKEGTSSSFEGVKPMDGMQKAVSKNMEKTLTIPVFRVSRCNVFQFFILNLISK